MNDDHDLPPLVLRCRLVWLLTGSLSSLILLMTGAAAVAGAVLPDGGTLPLWTAPIVLPAGAGTAYLTVRHGLARLILDDRGFRLAGPLSSAEVEWTAVERYRCRRSLLGPATLQVVYGRELRRLSVPLIYENREALLIGIGQRRFPQY